MHLELTDEQTDALIRALSQTIDGDRYPLSPRIVALRGILGQLRPEPQREPLPPLWHYEPPSKGRYRVRVFSPLGFYPRHSIALADARLLVNDELVVSSVYVEPPEAHGLEHSFDLEFLALEETRFLAGIALAVHPDNGMACPYPLHGHVDIDFGLDDDQVIEAAQQLATRIFDHSDWSRRKVPPPACGGPAYQWCEASVDVDNVLNVVCATQLNDHLLMRGLGALLRAGLCWQHPEIAEAAALQLYVALDASFQIILRLPREQGVSNPTALDAGALIDEVFNPEIETGSYFEDYYEDRIKTTHPSSRFGVFAVTPLYADDYYFLRHAMVEVYHWLITKQKLQPSLVAQ
jgi:hypothetical protein